MAAIRKLLEAVALPEAAELQVRDVAQGSRAEAVLAPNLGKPARDPLDREVRKQEQAPAAAAAAAGAVAAVPRLFIPLQPLAAQVDRWS